MITLESNTHQTMVENVAMSGVVMTKVLDDGSPYYVINFDDSTGMIDTVTGGTAINKTATYIMALKMSTSTQPP